MATGINDYKDKLATQASYKGYRVLTNGWPDLLIFQWDPIENRVVEAVFIEAKKLQGGNKELSEPQYVMLQVLRHLGLKVKLSYNGDLNDLIDFDPDTLEDAPTLAQCGMVYPNPPQVALHKKNLADATYKKYRRAYRVADCRIGTPYEQPRDRQTVQRLKNRFILANRPLPSSLDDAREKLREVIALRMTKPNTTSEEAIDYIINLLENPPKEEANGETAERDGYIPTTEVEDLPSNK